MGGASGQCPYCGKWAVGGVSKDHMQSHAKEIDDVVCQILMTDGPDGHVDGHEEITSFIVAALAGKAKDWAANYRGNRLG